MVAKRKPWYRPRNVALGVLAIVLIVIAWAGYWVYWALTVEPNPSNDYAAQLEQLSRDAQPPGENGWPDIMRAVAIYDQLEQAFPEDERNPMLMHGFDFDAIVRPDYQSIIEDQLAIEGVTFEAMKSELVQALDWLEARGAWEALARAREKDHFVRPMDTKGGMLLDILLPEIATLRMMATARLASLQRAMEEDDDDAAMRAAQDMLTIYDATMAQPIVLNALVADGFRQRLYRHLEWAIAADHVNPTLASRLLQLLNDNPPQPDVAMHIDAERRMVLDTIQWFYSDDGDGTLLLAKLGPIMTSATNTNGLVGYSWGQPDWHPITNLGGIAFESRATATAKANELFDAMIQYASSQTRGHADDVDAVGDQANALPWEYGPVTLFMSNLGQAVKSHDVMRAHHHATRIMLAIELFEAEHDAPPATLDALTPNWLDAVPLDPVSVTPFGYRVLSEDEHGRTYVLYSYGLDGNDNNGVEPISDAPRDAAIYIKTPTDSDFVFNQPSDVY